MNEYINEKLELIYEIEKRGYTTDQAIEIYKGIQLEEIADNLRNGDITVIDVLDSIEEAISNLTDENGIQYVKGEIAHCAY